MKGKSLPNLALPLLLLGCLCIAAAAHAGPAVYLDAFGKLVAVDHPAATNPVSALNVLADGAPPDQDRTPTAQFTCAVSKSCVNYPV